MSLSIYVCNEIKQTVAQGGVAELATKTGLSKHWFYRIASGEATNPTTKAVDAYMEAVNHPFLEEIRKVSNG